MVDRLEDLGEIDAIIITAMRGAEAMIETASKTIAREKYSSTRVLRLALGPDEDTKGVDA